MNQLNICYCGTFDGYPHKDDCPRPLFRASDRRVAKWEKERAKLQAPQYTDHADMCDSPCPRCGGDHQREHCEE